MPFYFLNSDGTRVAFTEHYKILMWTQRVMESSEHVAKV